MSGRPGERVLGPLKEDERRMAAVDGSYQVCPMDHLWCPWRSILDRSARSLGVTIAIRVAPTFGQLCGPGQWCPESATRRGTTVNHCAINGAIIAFAVALRAIRNSPAPVAARVLHAAFRYLASAMQKTP